MSKTNHQPEYLLRELGSRGLDPVAKERLRAHLSAYVDFHASPAREHTSSASAGLFGAFAAFSSIRWYAPTAAVLMFVLLAGGTAYASEASLPGDALYTVKIRVAEPIEVALATTPEKKAQVHADLAERRIKEATKLAVAQTLTPETADFLEKKFSKHVDAHLAVADELAAEGKVDASLDTRSDLEAHLSAHADILDMVEDHLETAPEAVQEATETVLAAVKLRQEVVSETRIALEREVADDATPTETLALVTRASEAVSVAAKTTIIPPVAEHAAEADKALSQAKDALEDGPGDTDRAFKKALESDRASEVVTTLLENSELLMAIAPAVEATSTATTTATTTSEAAPAQ